MHRAWLSWIVIVVAAAADVVVVIINAHASLADAHLEESAQIQFVYKDLRTYLRIFGRIAELFHQSFEDTFAATFQMMRNFLALISDSLKGYDMHSDIPEYVKLTAEAYGVLLSFIPWLVTFQKNASCVGGKENGMLAQFDSLCSDIVNACLVCMKPEVPFVGGRQ